MGAHATDSIFLVGFMGAGKSFLGRKLAISLNLPFFDLDREIEKSESRNIPTIFQERGEAAFRVSEERVLAQLSLPAVVALGGGAFISEKNRAFIGRKGRSVYLDWPFETLCERILGDPHRPLAGNELQLASLFQDRLPVYRLADLDFCPDFSDPDSAVRVLVERLA